MEVELGVKVFDRVGRRVFLTPAGRDLLERCYEVRKGMDSLTSRATELATGPFGLTTPLSANGSLRGAAYATLANFLPVSRFLVGCGNNTGALQETALVSAMLVVKRIS